MHIGEVDSPSLLAGTYPSQHQNTESQMLYQGGSLGAIPSCDYMAAKTSSVVIKEDLGDRARTHHGEHIAIMLKPRGVQLNVECASSTYVRNFRKQTTELSSSCTYPLSKALNLTSFEADGLVALTLGGLFRDTKDASPQTLNHFLKSQGSTALHPTHADELIRCDNRRPGRNMQDDPGPRRDTLLWGPLRTVRAEYTGIALWHSHAVFDCGFCRTRPSNVSQSSGLRWATVTSALGSS